MQLPHSDERAGCSSWSLVVTVILFFPSTQSPVHWKQERLQTLLFPNHKHANPHPLKRCKSLANQSSRITGFVSHLYGDWPNGVLVYDCHYYNTTEELLSCSSLCSHMPSANKQSWLLPLHPTAFQPIEHGRESKSWLFQPVLVACFSGMDRNNTQQPLLSS